MVASALLVQESRYSIWVFTGRFAVTTGFATTTAFVLIGHRTEFAQAERGLAPLRNSKSEIQQIKGISKKAFFNAQATWQNFAEKAPHYSILHLATHASADSVRNSAGVEFFERRAFLSDIYALPLHADLICLSACQSGLGEWRDGEGVMSLARAFAYAGSKGLVATLWSVNEASSSVLFQSFYTHLHQGMSKAAALNQAKQGLPQQSRYSCFSKNTLLLGSFDLHLGRTVWYGWRSMLR